MAELTELGKNACAAKYILQKLTTEEKNKALDTAANYLCDRQAEILAANESDLENGRRNGMNPGLLDRLKLTSDRIAQIAEGLRQISELPDCIGEVMEHFERPNGLKIDKVRVPLGVIGIIYEARPNVTADAFGLCFKTGNAVILKGGSDAIHSNIAIVRVLQDALDVCKMPRTAVQLIEDTDRAVTAQFMKMKEYVDVHPAKMELRFQNGEGVYDCLRRTLEDALYHKDLIPKVPVAEEKPPVKPVVLQHAPEPFEKNRMPKRPEPSVPQHIPQAVHVPEPALKEKEADTEKTRPVQQITRPDVEQKPEQRPEPKPEEPDEKKTTTIS